MLKNMQEIIEVEMRGRLTAEQHADLLKFLEENAEFVESKERILLDYSTFLSEQGVRQRTKDIRLRITNGQPELITKLGTWGGREQRKEISVKTEPGSFDNLVQTYAALGFEKAMLCVRSTKVFNYEGIELSLVKVPGHSYYFEAEKIVEVASDTEQAHKQIEAVCAELGLSLFDDTAFHDYIEELNKEANETFNYSDYKPGYFSSRFGV